jgi:deoxyribodipyrimidine photo-lyase
MRGVPDSDLFEPWLLSQQLHLNADLQAGADITQPVVELAQATREAKQRLHARRQNAEVKAGKKAVVDKHASRKPMVQRKSAATSNEAAKQQLGFDF